MKNVMQFLTIAFLAAACASEQVVTPVESVQNAQETVDKTNEFVNRADKTITEFQSKLKDLMSDASKSDKMRGKDKFSDALTGMDRRIAESRRDLARLKESNTESWETYKGEINSARDSMRSNFKESSKDQSGE